jgi:hypothetical protein
LLLLLLVVIAMLVWPMVPGAVTVTCCSVFERLRYMCDSFRAHFLQVVPHISSSVVGMMVLGVATTSCC